ncbi:unnamed protein product [Orchesella dallaii]|uniref:GT23 domain-containing protein n=1 Tax=Orchesella dallaii TaxID=48710 RepID=A0ABP1Q307_9HEXA
MIRSCFCFFNVITIISLVLWYHLLGDSFHLSVDQLKNYVYHYTVKPNGNSSASELLQEIADLKLEISEMKFRLNLQEQGDNQKQINLRSPTVEYERLRQDLEADMADLIYQFRGFAQAAEANMKSPQFEKVQNLHRLITSHVWKLGKMDGYKEFRQWERKELGRIVQKRIELLQNPTDCGKARKLLCSVETECGFGCTVHQVVYCLITAYATSRTLILKLKDDHGEFSWNQLFLPLSETCVDPSGSSFGTWDGSGDYSAQQVLSVDATAFQTLIQQEAFHPPVIPSDIATRLERVSSEPAIWWTGQFANYVLRLKPEGKRMITAVKIQTRFPKKSNTSVTVGVHVGRMKKFGMEANPYPLEEYKVHMENYLTVRDKVEGNPLKRNVFLAKNNLKRLQDQDGRKLNRKSIRSSRNESNQRDYQLYNLLSNEMAGTATDMFLLAECDYVMCSDSSNFCRLVAELMETKDNAEPLRRVMQLDFVYNNKNLEKPPMNYLTPGTVNIARFNHVPAPTSKLEIELEVGDLISNAVNQWNGMSYGINQRTMKSGLYPTYKTKIGTFQHNFPKNKWWDFTEHF